MTNATLTKATDTPRATAAPKRTPRKTPVTVTLTAPTVTPVPVTTAAKARVKTSEFVTLVIAEEKNTGKKVAIIGKALASGATNADITADLTAALLKADRVVPKSFASSVTHYATAYAAASTVLLSANLDCLHAAYQISTGAVKAADREKFIAEFEGGSPEAFISGCRALLKAARDAKKGVSTEPEDMAELDDVAELPMISPLEDFRAIMRQAEKLLDLAADADDATEYHAMLDLAIEFAATFTPGA